MNRFNLFIFFAALASCLHAQEAGFSTESLPLGAVSRLQTEYGVWTAPESKATVLVVPNQSRRALHYFGGEGEYLTLSFPKPHTFSDLQFELERWTSRAPFQMTVQARYVTTNPTGLSDEPAAKENEANAEAWKTVLSLDDKTPVGYGHTYTAKINGTIDAFRLTGTSYPGLGILIHEMTPFEPGPMRVVSCQLPFSSEKKRVPILIAAEGTNPPTELQSVLVRTQGRQSPLALEKITVQAEGAAALASISANLNGVAIKQFDSILEGTNTFDLTDSPSSRLLLGVKDRISVLGTASAEAALDKQVSVAVRSVTIGGKEYSLNGAKNAFSFGTLVRDIGWDDVKCYRIPGLVKTPPDDAAPQGTLVAVYDIRRKGSPDLPADIDIGVSRSLDNGRTWLPMQTVLDMERSALIKDNSLGPVKEGVGDPAILRDDQTGRLWIAALWAHNGKATQDSLPGLRLGDSGQLVLSFSDDNGANWSEPINITNQAAPGKNWRLLFQGPGGGITTRDGTLVFPAQLIDQDGEGRNRAKRWSATIVYSKDRGKTWTAGAPAKFGTCEAQVVELNDGSLMLNMRNFSGSYRSVAVTRDCGATWSEHPSSGKVLVEPICQASLLRVALKQGKDDRNVLAFFNPASSSARVDMTLKLSEDEGLTWPKSILVNSRPCFGYSCMTMLDKETIGVLYESSGGLIFQQIKWKR